MAWSLGPMLRQKLELVRLQSMVERFVGLSWSVPCFPNRENSPPMHGVLANYPTYLGERYPNLPPEQRGTTGEKALQVSNQPEGMLKDVTGFTLVLGPNQIERLIQELEAFGYKIRWEGGKRIA